MNPEEDGSSGPQGFACPLHSPESEDGVFVTVVINVDLTPSPMSFCGPYHNFIYPLGT
jgi:hypothetical protein